MKTTVVGIVAGVGGLALGLWAGWELRKRQEVQFVEVTEEEQQKYAAQFEKKMGEDDSKNHNADLVNDIPKIEKEEVVDGTNVTPALDTRKIDYANAWKRDEIKQREHYGDPTPGDEENIEEEEELESEVSEIIDKTRIEPISSKDFYNPNINSHRESVFWYDRDDVITHLNDGEAEEIVEDPDELFMGGINIKKEFENADDVELENAGTGMMLYRKDNKTDILFQLIRYPSSYAKRKEQEEYGGTTDNTDYLEWMHRRN